VVQPTVAVNVTRDVPDDWRDQLFAGALLIVTDVADLAPFRSHVERLLTDAFAAAAPPDAQAALGDDEFRSRAPAVRAAFRRDQRARTLLHPVVDRFGLDATTTYWDRLNLRVLPSGAEPGHHADVALGAHRDSWSSNVYAQVNWWVPLYPITAERAVAFYPRHWTRPLPNTSGAWDLDELRRQRAAGGPVTVPLIPEPHDPPDPSDAVVVVVQPGDVLLFSGAHLHATVPNASGRPRFSVEIRTVALDDLHAGRGAPNVDGAAPRVPWGWFRNVADDAPLTADVARAG
jgi:hypothetical protein